MKTKLTTVVEAQRMLREIRELREHPVWVGEMQPWLDDMARVEAAAHEDATKTAEQRAEHLWSMKLFREGAGLLEYLEARVKKWLAENREKQS